MRGLPAANPGTGTPDRDLRITTLAVTTPINSPDLRPADTFEDAMNTDVTPGAPLPETGDPTLIATEASHNPSAKGSAPTDTGSPVTTATKNPPPTNVKHTIATNAEDTTAINPKDLTAANTENPTATNAKNPTTTDAGNPTRTSAKDLHSPSSLVSLDDINEANVPAFLLRHGKGRRQVNIFDYLRKVEDPHFQEVLLHYLRFEINDKSQTGGSLPTTNRPVEISQWTTKARPAIIPDYMSSGRTFTDFVDSAFGWWASIQPAWRKFDRSVTSREVKGGWEVIYSPRINGFLNVVILAYWWIRILGEHKPEGDLRADYEFFAADVAWVLSKLSN
jgi:hypothetical protein